MRPSWQVADSKEKMSEIAIALQRSVGLRASGVVEGRMWAIAHRSDQNVVAIAVKSDDYGQTLNGTITYNGEGPIGFRAKRSGSNDYTVENQWRGKLEISGHLKVDVIHFG